MWRPISEAPKNTKKMFVVRASNVFVGSGRTKYTTDPYCVWTEDGEFVRWPHNFPPTEFMELPE